MDLIFVLTVLGVATFTIVASILAITLAVYISDLARSAASLIWHGLLNKPYKFD